MVEQRGETGRVGVPCGQRAALPATLCSTVQYPGMRLVSALGCAVQSSVSGRSLDAAGSFGGGSASQS